MFNDFLNFLNVIFGADNAVVNRGNKEFIAQRNRSIIYKYLAFISLYTRHSMEKNFIRVSLKRRLIWLYFIVKNHSFTDGNKRIAAALFIYFLDVKFLLELCLIIRASRLLVWPIYSFPEVSDINT